MSTSNQRCRCGSGKKARNCCEKTPPLESRLVPTFDNQPVLLIGMPTRGSISVETFSALTSHHDGYRIIPITSARLPVIEARNLIAAKMIEASKTCPWNPKPREFYCLWIDSDAFWTAKSIAQAVAILQTRRDIDLLAASFSMRIPFSGRVAYRKADDPESFPKPGIDCAMGDLVEVERVGFHFVIHRVSLLERLGPNPFATDWNGVGEDTAFCRRVRDVGGRIFCAPGLIIGHVDPNDGSCYVPGEAALRVEGNALKRTGGSHMVPKLAETRTYGDPILDAASATGQ